MNTSGEKMGSSPRELPFWRFCYSFEDLFPRLNLPIGALLV
jgi:hypothetical protein